MKKVLIIGGVAGGASAAARLRRNDESAKIVIFERGEYISYANCGLPYYIGDVIDDREMLFVQNATDFRQRFNVDVRTFNEVISINRTKKTVEVRDLKKNVQYTESYDKLILSPGAKPLRPPIKGIDNPAVFTLRNVEDTDAIKDYINQNNPSRAVIIGAGYIGLEMAESLKNNCSSVSLVEMADRVIPFFDYEMSAMIEQHIRFNGVDVLLNERVIAIEKRSDLISGKTCCPVNVLLTEDKKLPADIVILATGVKPDTDFLKDSGIELQPNGSIIVNDYLQTNDPDIYAVGDAIFCKHKILNYKLNIYLAGPAAKQSRIVADNITDNNPKIYEGTIGTAIIKVFELTAGYTGISEDSLKSQKRSYIASITHGNSHAGYYPRSLPLTIKTIFKPDDGELLGTQIIGYDGIDKRIDVVAALIHKRGTVFDLASYDHAYAPPYSSAKDPLTIAGCVAENIIQGKVNIVTWGDVNPEFLKEVQLLDVRTIEENEIGNITNSLLIPLDELRDRLNEIPKDKKILIYCRAGQRGYLAACILKQNGFRNVYNLSGGFKTYETAYHLACCKDTYEEELQEVIPEENVHKTHNIQVEKGNVITLRINACGLQCPGPIIKLKSGMDQLKDGEILEIKATDPGFINDLKSWCAVTGNKIINLSETEGTHIALLKKQLLSSKPIHSSQEQGSATIAENNNKTIIVFSDDMDRALASFVIANGAAAMGRQVTMFFTFWGLNVIKRTDKPKIKRDFMGYMFGKMMPAHSHKLNLSKMNMMGMGSKMMRMRMQSKQVDSLETMIKTAIENGVRLIACQMSMDVMGVVKADLIDNVEIGGVATYLEQAEKSNVNLFI